MCRLRPDANVEFTVVIQHENLWKFTEQPCDMKIKLNSLYRLDRCSFELKILNLTAVKKGEKLW